MGKASKWFRGLILGPVKNSPHHDHPNYNPTPPAPNYLQPVDHKPKKKLWSFAKSHKEKVDHHRQWSNQGDVVSAINNNTDAGKHTIALVELTSNNRHRAAVMIQSHFRAHLSRRALRALRSLVKLQALVRGHLVRKRTAYALRGLQALVRAQARARAGRALMSESPNSSFKSPHFNSLGPATPEKFEHVIRGKSTDREQATMLKRSGAKPSGRAGERLCKQLGSHARRSLLVHDDELSRDNKSFGAEDTVDNPCIINPKHRRRLFQNSSSQYSNQNRPSFSTTSKESTSSIEVQSLNPVAQEHQSPQFHYPASSMGAREGAFTPDGSRSCCLSGFYSDHPNYMAYTESSKAKVRSLSAPKQRPTTLYERSSSVRRVSVLQANFANKDYTGSGRLDRLGMPVRGNA